MLADFTKKLSFLFLILLLVSTEAFAQSLPCKRNDDAATTINAVNGGPGYCSVSNKGRQFINSVNTGTTTATQPSVTTATSFTCLASNTSRKTFTLQNNSAANIMISLTGATLTGIVPTSTNIGLVLTPGSSYTCPSSYCTTSAITCYQTSGGTINTISVVEGT